MATWVEVTEMRGGRTLAGCAMSTPSQRWADWLRAGARRADALRLCGVKWTVALSEELGRPWLADSPLQYALDALGGAAIWRLRFGVSATPWELIVAFTGGLLSGRPRDPPGY
jgi:hypothetical protein